MSFTVNPEPNDSDTTPTSDPVEDQPTTTDPTTEPDVETPTTDPEANPFTEDDTEDDELAFGTESDEDEDDESKYEGQGPLKTTDQVDHLYSYEIDERKKNDKTGVYYDDLKLMEAEQHRARVEGREPDYDNMAGIASTPLLRMTKRAPDEYHS